MLVCSACKIYGAISGGIGIIATINAAFQAALEAGIPTATTAATATVGVVATPQLIAAISAAAGAATTFCSIYDIARYLGYGEGCGEPPVPTPPGCGGPADPTGMTCPAKQCVSALPDQNCRQVTRMGVNQFCCNGDPDPPASGPLRW